VTTFYTYLQLTPSSISSRQLALFVEDGADCICIGLGDEEHAQSMALTRALEGEPLKTAVGGAGATPGSGGH
jgi:hypothetical protein